MIEGFQEAFTLIIGGDSELVEIVLLSLRVSGIALLISTLIGIPLGALLGLARFRGRRLSVALVYTGMAFPPVVIGLFVYLMLSRSGVLGSLTSAVDPAALYAGGHDRRPGDHRLPAGGRLYHGGGAGRRPGTALAGAGAGRVALADDAGRFSTRRASA